MRDDYLWDGSGEPDPEIRQLEAILGRFRHHRPAPAFPEMPSEQVVRQRFWQKSGFHKLAAAAAVVLVIAALLIRRSHPTPASQPGWNVARVAGAPRVGSKAITSGGSGRLAIGQLLETDSHSRASITVDEVGQVDVEPDTRLRLLKAGSGQRRLALDRGTIHAVIWAPPGEFVVDTPSAVAVDLGCAYTLHVDNSGAGLLRTKLGWVGFKLEGRESFIPAGAAAQPGRRLDRAHLTSKTRPGRFVQLYPSSILRPTRLHNATPASRSSSLSPASVMRLPSGTCSLVSAIPSAVGCMTAWLRSSLLRRG